MLGDIHDASYKNIMLPDSDKYQISEFQIPSRVYLQEINSLRAELVNILRAELDKKNKECIDIRAELDKKNKECIDIRAELDEKNKQSIYTNIESHKTQKSIITTAGVGQKYGDVLHYPEGSTRFVAECDLPTDRGIFRLRAYTYRGAKVVVRNGENVLEWTEMEPVIIYKGDMRGNANVVVRVHDQCYTSEVLGSRRCDCREQLEMALDYINLHGGALVYMPQEGRGIGLANKIAAYQLQDGGLDTVDANRALGFGDEERDYACVPYMLNDMGIKGICLMTNNPFKIRTLTELGVNIIGAKAHIVASNEFNAKYLRTKAARMAHVLPVMKNGVSDADAECGAHE